VAILGVDIILFIKGFSWAMLGKLVLASYSVHARWKWRIKEDE